MRYICDTHSVCIPTVHWLFGKMDDTIRGISVPSLDVLKTVKGTTFDDLLSCIQYLKEMGGDVNDVRLSDQYCNLKSFVGLKDDKFFDKLILHEQWCSYIRSYSHETCYSELLKICEFFFCIPGHNTYVERAFSLINAQWTKERLSDSVRGILFTKYNLKKLSYIDFHAYVAANDELLKKVASSEKYDA